MKQVLKNKNIEIQIDFPMENYKKSRFDWTGKISAVIYKNKQLTANEKLNNQNDSLDGKGFYNEFGIELPIGFDEIKEGEWFHKIGVGLLKKEGANYLFNENYEIQPAKFEVTTLTNKIKIDCESRSMNGFSYHLIKDIELFENSFVLGYSLKNTGLKKIITNEYSHNFISIDKELIDSNYVLKFPFQLNSALFDATVNPKENILIQTNEFTFKDNVKDEFFFSNLSAGKKVNASWELINKKAKIGIRETGSFETSKINLWGSNHVISPELFFEINLNPNQELKWSRTYNLFEIE
ncbi:hypothetical protein [uncultured Lutibacter sp.]|uniref:hypothetical protein n=1 Tax=uncultured Lutibacter sp. TaxID=437739 RepID=UPI002630BD98|nr:hypothetical protein [uncultured Lutibacter sp.]